MQIADLVAGCQSEELASILHELMEMGLIRRATGGMHDPPSIRVDESMAQINFHNGGVLHPLHNIDHWVHTPGLKERHKKIC